MYIEYFIRYTLNNINQKTTANIEKNKDKVEQRKKVENEIKVSEEKKEINENNNRDEEIKESLKTMIKPVTEDYERNKIINKIKNGNVKNEKTR